MRAEEIQHCAVGGDFGQRSAQYIGRKPCKIEESLCSAIVTENPSERRESDAGGVVNAIFTLV